MFKEVVRKAFCQKVSGKNRSWFQQICSRMCVCVHVSVFVGVEWNLYFLLTGFLKNKTKKKEKKAKKKKEKDDKDNESL